MPNILNFELYVILFSYTVFSLNSVFQIHYFKMVELELKIVVTINTKVKDLR